jgi:hypothetical protein
MACLAGLVALAAAGCGGSSKATTTSSPAAGSTTAPSTGAGGSTAPTTSTSPASGATTPATGTPQPADPARAKFIAQADQICTAANTALVSPQAKVDAAVKAEQKKGSTAHRKALANAVRAEASVASAELDRLRALHPPAGDELVFGKYVAAVASQVQLIDELAADVAADNGPALKPVSTKLAAGKQTVDDLAGAYGFKVCGNVAS